MRTLAFSVYSISLFPLRIIPHCEVLPGRAGSLCSGLSIALGNAWGLPALPSAQNSTVLSKYIWSLWSTTGARPTTPLDFCAEDEHASKEKKKHSRLFARRSGLVCRHSSPLVSSLRNRSFKFSSRDAAQGRAAASAQGAGFHSGQAASPCPASAPQWGGAASSWGFGFFPWLGLLQQSIF